jgi:ATP-dependent DNA ligase
MRTERADLRVNDSTLLRGHLNTGAVPSSFIEPYPPRRPRAARLDLVHEIKHEGYRLMARRDPVGIRLITRRGNDWPQRFPLIVEAVNHLRCGPA